MEHEQVSCGVTLGRDHLTRLRDFLDLPLNALTEGGLSFALPGDHVALVTCTGNGRLTLICELAALDALADGDWRMLAMRVSGAYDPAFPVSLATVERQLALIWNGSADDDIEPWLHKVEAALIFSLDLQAALSGQSLADRLLDGEEE